MSEGGDGDGREGEEAGLSGAEARKLREGKVYLAPEIPLLPAGPGQQSPGGNRGLAPPQDVYAYSMILVEIATRNDPYGVSEVNILSMNAP